MSGLGVPTRRARESRPPLPYEDTMIAADKPLFDGKALATAEGSQNDYQ
jgi:hypothetical protein